MRWGGPDARDPGFASDTTARVGELLERAEARAREIRERAERSARAARRTARHEAERIAHEARAAAAAAARVRAREISELRASIAARAGTLVEGLEGGELTAARLNDLVAALGEAADRVLREVAGDTAGPEVPVPSFRAPFPGRGRAVAGRREEPAPEPAKPVEAPAREPEPIVDPLPEGVPIARRPARRSSARFAAVTMAIQGSGREEVADYLAREHGLADADELLDDVFGRPVERG